MENYLNSSKPNVVTDFLSAWLQAEPWQRDIVLAQMKGLAKHGAAVRRDAALFKTTASASGDKGSAA